MVAYNRDIPDAPNNPSTDQPKMKQNTNAIDDLISVDHLSFQATNFGTHKQTAFENFSAGVVPGGVPASVAYPAAGVAEVTRAQYYFKNSTNTFILSALRAFAYVTGATGAIIAGQSSNVTSVTRNSAGNYTVTIPANVLTSANYMVFTTASRTSGTQMVHSYSITSATSFDLRFSFPVTGTVFDPVTFAFAVIQI
jgi:hypothetical protein